MLIQIDDLVVMHENLPNSRFHGRIAKITQSCLLIGPDGKPMQQHERHMYKLEIIKPQPGDEMHIDDRWIVSSELRKLNDLEVIAKECTSCDR